MTSKAEQNFLELLRRSPKTPVELEEMNNWRELFEQELKQELETLSQQLKEAGSKYTDPWELVNTKSSYPEAIDILVEHIPKNYHDKNKEGIFRALTVKEAKGKANIPLIEEYNRIDKKNENLRWVIGHAFCVIITSNDIDDIISIVMDSSNGTSRSGFVTALGKLKSKEIENVLIDLLKDKEMSTYALDALNKLKINK